MNLASSCSRWRWKSRWARASRSACRAARIGRRASAVATPATAATASVVTRYRTLPTCKPPQTDVQKPRSGQTLVSNVRSLRSSGPGSQAMAARRLWCPGFPPGQRPYTARLSAQERCPTMKRAQTRRAGTKPVQKKPIQTRAAASPRAASRGTEKRGRSKRTPKRTPGEPPKQTLLGGHQSIAGGLSKAVDRATETGCLCLQIFTRNINRWDVSPIDPEEAARFRGGRRVGTRPRRGPRFLPHQSGLGR